jgi:pyridoxamine 5'-phosphate oxidase
VRSRAVLVSAVAAAARRFGVPYDGPGSAEPEDIAVEVPRPPHWGGYRLHVDAMELWVEGEYRIHDRARWTRVLDAPHDVNAATNAATTWSVTRLQP